MQHFGDIAFTPESQRHQRRRGSFAAYEEMRAGPAPDGLGDDEIAFLTERDSVFVASVGANGWPYVQHRGGPAGFIHVVDPTHIAWAERAGNRQYVSAGNIDHNGRISLIAVDQPARRRMKLYGIATFDPDPDPALVERLGVDGRIEGVVVVEVVAFDWNCPKYITPRFTAEQVSSVINPMRERIRELEDQLAAAR